MSNQPRPAPRASSTDDTPPSGIDLDVVRSLPLESAVLYLGEELRKMREDQARELASIVRHQRATNESVGGLIEAVSEQTRTIGDLRIIVERAAVHADRAATKAEDAFAAVGRVLGEASVTRELAAGAVRDVAAVREIVGTPPVDLTRASQVGEHTAEELAQLERGTGIAGVVGRLVAGQSRLGKRVAIGAGISAAAAPIMVEIVKAIAGGF